MTASGDLCGATECTIDPVRLRRADPPWETERWRKDSARIRVMRHQQPVQMRQLRGDGAPERLVIDHGHRDNRDPCRRDCGSNRDAVAQARSLASLEHLYVVSCARRPVQVAATPTAWFQTILILDQAPEPSAGDTDGATVPAHGRYTRFIPRSRTAVQRPW